MEWMQVFTIVVTLLGGVFYIHSDVKDLKKDIQQQIERIDRSCEAQAARSDRLYGMFIDLLKKDRI